MAKRHITRRGQEDDESVERRAPVGDRHKQHMLSVLMRDESAYDTVQAQLEPSHFRETYLELAWSSFRDMKEQYGQAPNEEFLLGEIQNRLQQVDDDDYLSEDEFELLDQFIQVTYALTDDEVSSSVGIALKIAQQVLEENLHLEASAAFEGQIAANLPALLTGFASRAEAINTVDSTGADVPFPDDLTEMPELIKIPTGISFIDRYMNGGQCATEVYGFLGPFGSCKTTTVCQLGVNRVRHDMTNFKETGIAPPITYLVFWEEPMQSVQNRLLSCFADIHINVMESRDFSSLTSKSKGNYNDRERRNYKDDLAAGRKPPGQLDRLAAAKVHMNRCLRILCLGTEQKYAAHAVTMADGVRAVIEADQRKLGNPGVSMVVCDYAGAAAKMKIGHEGLSPDKVMRHLIGGFPMAIKSRIGVPYNCPTWVMHQLNTQANTLSPGQAPKMTQAAEAGNFAENLSFCFMVGNQNKDGLCTLTNVKHRRAGAQSDIVIRIDGAFAQVFDASDKWVLKGSNFISRDDLRTIADDDEGYDGSGDIEEYIDDDEEEGVGL
jgi:hypothetical protein